MSQKVVTTIDTSAARFVSRKTLNQRRRFVSQEGIEGIIMNTTDSNEQQGAGEHVHRFNVVRVPPQFGHSYRRCYCGLAVHLAGHDVATCEMCRSRAVSAAPADRKLYSELIHIAAELVRADGFLSPCAEDLAPKLRRTDNLLKTARAQDERLKDWAYRIRQVADKLSPATTSSPAQPDSDAAIERKNVLELIERFQRDPQSSQSTRNAFEWLRRQIEEGNHSYHTFESAPANAGRYTPDECFRCGLHRAAIIHLTLLAGPLPAAASEGEQEKGNNGKE